MHERLKHSVSGSSINTFQVEQARQALRLQVTRKVAIEDGAGGREDEVDAGLLRLPRHVRVEQGAEAGLRELYRG